MSVLASVKPTFGKPVDLPTIFIDALTRTYPPSSTVLHQGEVPRHVCIVKVGTVKVFNISASGEEQIITFITPGEVFPTPWLFGKTTGAIYFYTTLEQSEIILVPKQVFLEKMQNDLSCSQAVLRYYSEAYAGSMIRTNALEQSSADKKIQYTLYYLCLRYGQKEGVNTTVNLNITQQDIGALIGLTRETVALQLGKLKRDGIISYTRRKYSVNLAKLLTLIGEDSLAGVAL